MNARASSTKTKLIKDLKCANRRGQGSQRPDPCPVRFLNQINNRKRPEIASNFLKFVHGAQCAYTRAQWECRPEMEELLLGDVVSIKTVGMCKKFITGHLQWFIHHSLHPHTRTILSISWTKCTTVLTQFHEMCVDLYSYMQLSKSSVHF